MKNLFIIFLCILFGVNNLFGQMYEHQKEQKNGYYINPIIPADFSDIDVIRVGNDYYAISSTMQFSPGMVVLHSTDLLNWSIISHVVSDLTTISPELNWDRMNRYGRGIWAGSIRYYNNKFWVYFGTPDEGFFMSSASNPAGPWEPLHQVWKVSGWDDCCSFQDDDGQIYFIATNFSKDERNKKEYNIHLFKMSPDGKQLDFKSDSILYQAKGSEANKLYKFDGLYYHFFSQVNDSGQRYIMMGRSKNIYGPYEYKQLNKVDRKKDREPNQGGLINVDNKSWYFLTHHGRGDWEGRPVSLLPVSWIDKWPIIGSVGKDSIGEMIWEVEYPLIGKEKKAFAFHDDFKKEKLSVNWEWNYQPRDSKWSLKQRKGYLRLYAFKPIDSPSNAPYILRAGNTITQRSTRASSNIVEVLLDIDSIANGENAGLSHFSTTSYSSIGVRMEGGIKYLVHDNNGTDSVLAEIKKKNIWLKSSWDINGLNTYSYSFDGKKFIEIPVFSQLKWGSYRGDRIGIYNFNVLG